MAAPVLVFAVGNASRGDDALGPLLLQELDIWLISNQLEGEVELLEDFQLQIEHALDMNGRKLILFVDAGMNTPVPFSFYRIYANDEPVLYSHALSPEALLNVYTQFHKEVPPDAFVLCIQGQSFELGEPPTLQAATNLESAVQFAKLRLLTPEEWDRHCTTAATGSAKPSAGGYVGTSNMQLNTTASLTDA